MEVVKWEKKIRRYEKEEFCHPEFSGSSGQMLKEY